MGGDRGGVSEPWPACHPSPHRRSCGVRLLYVVLLTVWTFGRPAVCMTSRQISKLRNETTQMFYHGFDSYMNIAFPEDEIRPVSCAPLTRDSNPSNIGLNDVLGNYSLTLIDSL